MRGPDPQNRFSEAIGGWRAPSRDATAPVSAPHMIAVRIYEGPGRGPAPDAFWLVTIKADVCGLAVVGCPG